MKPLTLLIAITTAVVMASCGTEGYNPDTVSTILNRFNAEHRLSDDDYAELLSQQELEIEDRLANIDVILKTTSAADYDRAYAEYTDPRVEGQQDSLRHVLILGQMYYTPDLAARFAEVRRQWQILDLMTDRLNAHRAAL